LNFNFGGTSLDCISMAGSIATVFVQLDAGFTKDNGWITSDSAFLFSSGDYAEIIEENGTWNDKPATWAVQSVGQIVQIDHRHNDTLFLMSPLRITYDATLNPRVRKIDPRVNAGVECLKIKRIQSTRILVEGNYFHHSFLYDGASKHGYGVILNAHSGECLVTNNIFRYLRHAMMVKTGANGNVFSYNYSLDVHRSEPIMQDYGGDISLHGHYAYANLFEGNIVRNICIDHEWGPSGPYNTFFRNRAEGYGIIFSSCTPPYCSNSQHIVGNDVDYNGYLFGPYTITGTGHIPSRHRNPDRYQLLP
jgi:hypothetical protein